MLVIVIVICYIIVIYFPLCIFPQLTHAIAHLMFFRPFVAFLYLIYQHCQQNNKTHGFYSLHKNIYQRRE